jgi:hypothetical protein
LNRSPAAKNPPALAAGSADRMMSVIDVVTLPRVNAAIPCCQSGKSLLSVRPFPVVGLKNSLRRTLEYWGQGIVFSLNFRLGAVKSGP